MTRIDCHNHCSVGLKRWPDVGDVVENMQRLGIRQTCCSHPITGSVDDPEAVRRGNDDVLAAMERYPDVVLGQCHVNPGYAREAQDEITRCVVDHGMVGVKLYYQYRINEPVPRRRNWPHSRGCRAGSTSPTSPGAIRRPCLSAPISAAAATGSGK